MVRGRNRHTEGLRNCLLKVRYNERIAPIWCIAPSQCLSERLRPWQYEAIAKAWRCIELD